MTLHLFHRRGKWDLSEESYKWVPDVVLEKNGLEKTMEALPLQTRIVQTRQCGLCGKIQREVIKE